MIVRHWHALQTFGHRRTGGARLASCSLLSVCLYGIEVGYYSGGLSRAKGLASACAKHRRDLCEDSLRQDFSAA